MTHERERQGDALGGWKALQVGDVNVSKLLAIAVQLGLVMLVIHSFASRKNKGFCRSHRSFLAAF